MKLSRTKEYNFGWLVVFPLIDVVFLLIFFLLLSSNFVFQPGIAVSFRDQKTSLEGLGPLLDEAKRENRSIIIKADRQTPYELVVAVTNAALEHGISSVSLAGALPK